MLVSGILQGDYIYIMHIFLIFFTKMAYDSIFNIGPCLSILYIVVCI